MGHGPKPSPKSATTGAMMGSLDPALPWQHSRLGNSASRKKHQEFTCLSHSRFSRIIGREWPNDEAW